MAILLPAAGVDVAPWSRGDPIPVADVHWVTAADHAIAEIAALVPLDAIVLHASGALGPEALGDRAERGVLHPLMTFPGPERGLPSLAGVGARVDGTPRARLAAETLASALGMRPVHVPGDIRLYHAAAALASGHLSALFLDAARILAGAGLDEDAARRLLLPLASESLRQATEGGPSSLTGPATRGDRATEGAHLASLRPEEAAVYALLADRIRALRAEPNSPAGTESKETR